MKFKINGNTWEVLTISNTEIDNIESNNGENFIHGTTRYGLNKILVNKEAPEPLRTLKHELMHVWLYEYGHRADEKQFNEEDICEIVASSNDFINEIVEQYQKSNDVIIEQTIYDILINGDSLLKLIKKEQSIHKSKH